MKHLLWSLAALALLLGFAAETPAHAANCAGYTYTLTNGQTADATQVMSNFNTIMSCANSNLAKNGANSDITSLSGLATPLSPSQGGTGQSSSIFGSNNTWTGTQTYTGALSVNTTATLAGTSALPAAVLTNALEPATVSATAATGTINLYAATQSVLYYTTSAAANWTVNLSLSAGTTLNSAMSTGQAITLVFLATQGATPYYNTTVQVDGTTTGVTTKWLGGAPTAGGASGVDAYTYTVIKTGSGTFTVLASQASFN